MRFTWQRKAVSKISSVECLTVNPITEYEFRQCFQSDSSRSSGSFNLNPGVLLWHLVRMN